MKHAATVWLFLISSTALGSELLVEAEGFSQPGGWIVNPQFLDTMGSSYLLAHGLGTPVDNARTTVALATAGRYRMWVRTKNWAASQTCGSFRVVIGGKELATTFGNQGRDWIWQRGDVIELPAGDLELELKDLAGFDGRCDALYLTSDLSVIPPSVPDSAMADWRRGLLAIPKTPPSAGEYDVVVVGGGVAGCSATLAAARLGLHVALVQNRPVLGGNASPEIGITPRGQRRSIVDEFIGPERDRVLKKEELVELFLGWHAFRAETRGGKIVSVDARNINTNRELRFQAPVFIDCSGVGAVGFLAGAEYRMGREAKTEFDESLAPERADKMHHGNTIVFRTAISDQSVSFPEVPWAVEIAGDFAELGGQVVDGRDNIGGLTHFWEYGQWLDPFADGEQIRDHLLRAIYGTFSNVKRRYGEAADRLHLAWVGHVPAGGESRRLMGDYILTENDIRAQRSFPDAVAVCSGHFCLHYPGDKYDFRLGDWRFIPVQPYGVPFRCLFSRNVNNLMMAGKHISVTHIAGSSTKTMLNGGSMGVAVGAAAFLCQKYDTYPRDIYQNHLAELRAIVTETHPYEKCFRR